VQRRPDTRPCRIRAHHHHGSAPARKGDSNHLSPETKISSMTGTVTKSPVSTQGANHVTLMAGLAPRTMSPGWMCSSTMPTGRGRSFDISRMKRISCLVPRYDGGQGILPIGQSDHELSDDRRLSARPDGTASLTPQEGVDRLAPSLCSSMLLQNLKLIGVELVGHVGLHAVHGIINRCVRVQDNSLCCLRERECPNLKRRGGRIAR
jgi:hypothetical protein